MGFLLGHLKFVGRIGGLVYADTKNGNTVTELGGVTRKRVLTDPDFQMTRENAHEFGGASSLASKFYTPLSCYKDIFKPMLWSKLQGDFVKVLRDDPSGIRGVRTVDLLNNGDVILDLDLGIKPINSILRFPIEIEITDDRKLVNWSIPQYPEYRISGPKNKNLSFKVIMTASVLPKMIHESKKDYKALGTANGEFYLTESTIMKLDGTIPSMDLIIELDLAPQETDAIVVCVGIAFFESLANTQSFIKEEGGLKLVKIG